MKGSETKLERADRTELKKKTPNGRGGEDVQPFGRSLLPNSLSSRRENTETTTRAVSQSTSLKNTLRGTNNGVHLTCFASILVRLERKVVN